MQNKDEISPRKPEESFFWMGKYDLTVLSGEPNHIQSQVLQFVVHTDWNPNMPKFDADISLAVLVRTIQFNNVVQPICLWTATKSYDDMVGKEGIVAGWGRSDSNYGE